MLKIKPFNKLVIAIASSALFDLSESDKVYTQKGENRYRAYQNKNLNNTLKPGIAFSFIKKLLDLNNIFKTEEPGGVVEVVLLSRNSHETGLRVFKSIQHYKLDIQKAGFFSGQSPYKFIEAFSASLFLSSNYQDVKLAIEAGYPAGMVIKDKTNKISAPEDKELRIAFDFDGILADHEAEKVFRGQGLKKYESLEVKKTFKALRPGPLQGFAKKIADLRNLETNKIKKNKNYERVIRISLVSARSAPAHERAIRTLASWGIDIDQSFWLGYTGKKKILETLSPHIYFDDQLKNIKGVTNIASVFVPFGDLN